MILELGQNLKRLYHHSNIICQMIVFILICFHVLHNVRHKMSTIFMMLKCSFVLTYFQDHYVEESIDE